MKQEQDIASQDTTNDHKRGQEWISLSLGSSACTRYFRTRAERKVQASETDQMDNRRADGQQTGRWTTDTSRKEGPGIRDRPDGQPTGRQDNRPDGQRRVAVT